MKRFLTAILVISLVALTPTLIPSKVIAQDGPQCRFDADCPNGGSCTSAGVCVSSQFPITQPTAQPIAQPTAQPITQPTTQPATQPTVQPTTQPATQPTTQPTTSTQGTLGDVPESPTEAEVPPDCVDEECARRCQNLKEGYNGGHCLESNEECSPPTGSCTSLTTFPDGCCCIPCDDLDADCVCKNGTKAQVDCFYKTQIRECCPWAIQPGYPGIPDPNIIFVDDITNAPGYNGAAFCKSEGAIEDRIEIRRCNNYKNVCPLFIHEQEHIVNCYLGYHVDPALTGSSCAEIIEHLYVAYETYSQCLTSLNTPNRNCGISCDEPKNYLVKVCNRFYSDPGKCWWDYWFLGKTNSSSKDLQSYCSEMGISPPAK